MKKLLALVEEEECDVETDEIKNVYENKTITLIKNIKNCKPFIGVSVLSLCITIIFIRIMVYFLRKLKSNVLPY